MKYKSLAEVVEAKRAGTLVEGFRLSIEPDLLVGFAGEELLVVAHNEDALREALTLLGLRVEE